ncbi:sulfate/thiosulfate ABC superfamily ATP binding cassette transporter, ABC domain protein [Mycobacterium xenopi 3993]|nr:sulfate/thiosulfate ABC superfamily ATP binding cassette transporter, ABC domain protein [Mycobacterium xenopi 3993]
MGIAIEVEGLTKSFGPQRIWEDVTLDIPPARSACCWARRVPVSRCS